jgi:imidazolonepropionase
MTLVVDDIGLLVTCDPTRGEGPLGLVHNAALVVEDGHVVSIERAGAVADTRLSAEGRCVMPGFVDSHTHLVFAGDRSDEFASRMAGRPYSVGGIMTTVAATRAASTQDLGALAALRRYTALVSGTTHVEVKSGYGLDVGHEQRLCQLASGLTDDVTFLGAHTVPPAYADRVDAYVDLVCGEMLAACAPFARWIDVFCEEGAFDVDQSRAVVRAGRAAGLEPRVHANQLGFGPGVRLAVDEGAASADHCTYLTDEDVEALATSKTVATFLPASDFSTRQPYPDARRVIDAGATVAIASNCNPGSSYTSSMAFCIALAVREMHMTVEEAVRAATIGGAKALRRVDVGWLGPGARADAVILDAPTYVHLASRPGMALAHGVISGGEPIVR